MSTSYNSYKSILTYRPSTSLVGSSTQASTPTPTAPVEIVNTQPYDLREVYSGGKVDMGTLTWTALSGATNTYYTTISDKIQTQDGSLYCSIYTTTSESTSSMSNMTMRGTAGAGYFYVRNNSYTDAASFKSAMSGVYLYYQTTSQSTWTKPYTDKYFKEAGIDETRYTGGKVDLGTLGWSRVEPTTTYPYGFFASYGLSGKAAGITNVYVDGYTAGMGSTDKRVWGNASSGNIIVVVDSNYTDAATFKAAMSGVYLYYQTTSQDSWTAPTQVPAKSIIRQTGSITYDGSSDENWTFNTGTGYQRFIGVLSGQKSGTIRTMPGLSNCYIMISDGRAVTSCVAGDGYFESGYIYLHSSLSTTNAFRAQLAQYPVIVNYILATETIEIAPLAEAISYKSNINYKPNTDISGETTQTGTPTPTDPKEIVSKQPYNLNEIYTGGKVDMGTLTWTALSGATNTYYTTISDKIQTLAGGLYCQLYTTTSESTSSMSNMTMKGTNGAGYFYVRNNSYTDAASFKSAMSGIYLYYQTTSQSSWIKPYTDKYFANGGIDDCWYEGGKVDLGTYTWSKMSNISGHGNHFSLTISGMVTGLSESKLYISGSTYTATSRVGRYNLSNNQICQNTDGGVSCATVVIETSDYDDAAELQESLSGTYLYYQTSSQSSWTQPTVATAGQIVRHVGVKTFDGTEASDWTIQVARVYNSKSKIGMSTALNASSGEMLLLSNRFGSVSPVYACINVYGNVLLYAGWSSLGVTDNTTLNTWLAKNSTSIYFPLATPTIETAGLAENSTYKNIINA